MAEVDQRGFVNQPFLDGAEAAAFLGVKRATLYAYVSRGLLRSVARGPRARAYRKDDLERLKARHQARAGHGPVAAGALRFGEPVLASALTAIHETAGPCYCGTPAIELARRGARFEDVAERLWAAGLDAAPAPHAPWPEPRPAPRGWRPPGDAHPVLRLQLLVPALAAADAARHLPGAVQELQRARLLVASLAAAAGGAVVRPTQRPPSIAARLLRGFGVAPTPARVRAVQHALVVIADHELNVSTFGVRVAASAGADLYACASAGLAALSGPLHGGACDRVEALVAEVEARGAATVIRERTGRGEELPGFGHRLYPRGDPRTAALLRRARALAPKDRRLRALESLLAAMRGLGAEAPASDFGLVAVALAAGLPPGGASAIFAVGRAAGWMAHVFEQRRAGFLFRPRALYVGVSPMT